MDLIDFGGESLMKMQRVRVWLKNRRRVVKGFLALDGESVTCGNRQYGQLVIRAVRIGW